MRRETFSHPKANNQDGTSMSDKLANDLEGKAPNGMNMNHRENNAARWTRRSIERADLKDQIRSAKAIQIKSTRGFA